jgi:curli biogenesis system outer membrane secretion channel CsgG
MKNQNLIQTMPRLKTTALLLAVVTTLTLFAGCNKASEVAGNALDAGRSVATGKGGSVVSGSAGPAGVEGAAKQLVKCEAPIAMVAVNENPRGYAYATGGKYPNLPESPVPLVRLMLQQTGCFRVVDRFMGLDATRREIDLQNEGLTRKDTTVKPRGKVLESQYAVTPNLVFSETNAGTAIGGVVSHIPKVGQYAGALSGLKFAEAQVTMFVTDNETTEQIIAAEGSARATDIGLGGLMIGKLGGAGGLGWSNTNEGKVVAAAMLDAVNKVALQAQKLSAKELPPAVAVKTNAKKQ